MPRVGVLGARSCRPSTPSLASRGSPGRAARTPTRRGSRRAARRRTGGGPTREIPGAPMQTWNCSVSLRWKRMLGRRLADERRAHLRPLRRRLDPLAGGPLEQAEHVVVLEVAGGGEDDVPGHVRAAVVRGDRAPADRGDHLGPADHRPSERVLVEHGLGEQVVDELLRRVLDHRDLLEHHLALGVEVGEGRREDHVRHHVERVLEVPVGNARVDDRVLARRGRVQLAAHLVEHLGDLLRVVRARALEEQVLDEVRDTRLRRRARRGRRRRSRSRATPSGRSSRAR